jgi:hypothetical protein
MSKDLGTYHLRVELEDGRGWIQMWETGIRYMGRTDNLATLDALRMPPVWDSEKDLISTMLYTYLDGNYSCDCNKLLFLARANRQPEPEDPPCGDTLLVKRLTALRPDASEVVIFERNPNQITKDEKV